MYVIRSKVSFVVNKKIAELNHCELHFYVGITSRSNLQDRIVEHSNIHGMVFGEELSKFSCFADLCYAEHVGISRLFELSKSNEIKSCWNKTLGYDVGTLSAFSSSSNLSLYMLWAEQLNNRDKEIGALNRRRLQQQREDGKVWLLNTSCNVKNSRFDVERLLYVN